jgi:hypothetical protein
MYVYNKTFFELFLKIPKITKKLAYPPHSRHFTDFPLPLCPHKPHLKNILCYLKNNLDKSKKIFIFA